MKCSYCDFVMIAIYRDIHHGRPLWICSWSHRKIGKYILTGSYTTPSRVYNTLEKEMRESYKEWLLLAGSYMTFRTNTTVSAYENDIHECVDGIP